jgi:hypothetical protein
LQNIPDKKYFAKSIIFKYKPEKKSRIRELIPLVSRRTNASPVIMDFHRFLPYEFEENLLNELSDSNKFDEILIDISVMSKLMILIVINSLKDYNNKLKILYCEPDKYAPSREEYLKNSSAYPKSLVLPSYGIHDVIRTSLLSSVVMQRSPALIVGFLSFNEQLIRSLLSVINPTNLFIINGVPPSLKWRERAMVEIHWEIVKEYSKDNRVDDDGLLVRKASTLDYRETFQLLSSIYRDNCTIRRIIIAPTGSKMQAFACALFKICCSDVHIEYPTPESYYIEGYSSSKIINIYEVGFTNFINEIKQYGELFELNS